MNIIKNRYLFFGISLLVIIPGIIALILWNLPLGIDFAERELVFHHSSVNFCFGAVSIRPG